MLNKVQGNAVNGNQIHFLFFYFQMFTDVLCWADRPHMQYIHQFLSSCRASDEVRVYAFTLGNAKCHERWTRRLYIL
jgi:hypothetical protein